MLKSNPKYSKHILNALSWPKMQCSNSKLSKEIQNAKTIPKFTDLAQNAHLYSKMHLPSLKFIDLA